MYLQEAQNIDIPFMGPLETNGNSTTKYNDKFQEGYKGYQNVNGPSTIIGDADQTKMKGQSTIIGDADQTKMKGQFFKTKICKYFQRGFCDRGQGCKFAHEFNELRAQPDLSRTKLCKALILTGQCDDPSCPFAHSKDQLRATEAFHKTKLCRFWLQGSCSSGSKCRYAHDFDEITSKEKLHELLQASLQQCAVPEDYANSDAPGPRSGAVILPVHPRATQQAATVDVPRLGAGAAQKLLDIVGDLYSQVKQQDSMIRVQNQAIEQLMLTAIGQTTPPKQNRNQGNPAATRSPLHALQSNVPPGLGEDDISKLIYPKLQVVSNGSITMGGQCQNYTALDRPGASSNVAGQTHASQRVFNSSSKAVRQNRSFPVWEQPTRNDDDWMNVFADDETA